MVAKRSGVSKPPGSPRRRPAAALSDLALGRSVRVWGEVSITVAVTDDPPQFIKVTHGHERISKSDSEQDILRTEAQIHATASKVVERRAEELKRLVHRVLDEE